MSVTDDAIHKNLTTRAHETISSYVILSTLQSLNVIATQPLYTALRHQQASLQHGRVLSTKAAFSELMGNNKITTSIRPLFKGLGSSFAKVMWQSSYKAFLVKNIPDIISSSTMTTNHMNQSVLGGVVAAGVDTLLSNPINFYNNYRITSQGLYKNANFINEFNKRKTYNEQIRFIYRGSMPTFISTSLSYMMFFSLQKPLNHGMCRYYNVDNPSQLPFSLSLATGFFMGAFIATVNLPLDTIKTQMQAPGVNTARFRDAFFSSVTKIKPQAIFSTGLTATLLLNASAWMNSHIARNYTLSDLHSKKNLTYS
jgi:Mitochondrial carrier protein